MPEFSREELVTLYNLLGEFKDSLNSGDNYKPSLYDHKDELRKDIRKMEDKISNLLYPR